MLTNISIFYRIFVLSIYVRITESINAPTLTSGWLPITAYTNPEVTYNHNLGETPIKVDVQVKVYDPTLGADVIFNAISSAHRGDQDSHPFGGVIYVYNDNSVKIMAPGPCSTCPGGGGGNGKLVHLGGNSYIGPATSATFTSGHVHVRIWKKCDFARPSYVSGPIPISNNPGESYIVEPHPIGREPDLVIVQVFLGNGWVTDAQGITFYSDQTESFGGVVFAAGRYDIRLWTTKRGTGSADSNGVVFTAMDGWGNDGDFQYNSTANVQIWAWDFGELVHNPIKMETYLRNIPADGIVILSDTVTTNDFLTVKVKAEGNVNNDGYSFYAAGTAPTVESLGLANYYAGLVFGIKDDNILLWSPDPGESNGCLAMVGGLWGNGINSDCLTEDNVQIVVTLFYADTPEPPCESLGCNPSDIGPMCVCDGTGYEGQYCDSAVQCPRPISHENATFSPFGWWYTFQDTISFTCKDGYEKLSGDDFAQCSAYKNWTGAPFLCSPKQCGQPEQGIQASIEVLQGVDYSQTVTYKCTDGFSIKEGNYVRTCQANQTWSGSPPTCDTSCGEPENGTAVVRTNKGLTIGVTATYICNEGHEEDSGNFNRTCENDGTWSGVPPICIPVQCPIPENANNSQLSYASLDFGTNATYTCNEGYQSLGNTLFARTCQANRQWSDMGSCEKVICLNVPSGINAEIVAVDGNTYGDKIEYACQYGKMLVSGQLETVCQSDTSWNGSAPVCEDILCDDPGNVTNGTVHLFGRGYGASVIVICDEGFSVEFGDLLRVCGDGAIWSGSKPHCGEVYQVFVNPVSGSPAVIPTPGASGSGGTTYYLTQEDAELLLVPLKSTSSYRRSRSSADDQRLSAKVMGILGAVIILAPFVVCASLDVMNYLINNTAGASGGSNTNGATGQMAENSNSKYKNTAKRQKKNQNYNTLAVPITHKKLFINQF